MFGIGISDLLIWNRVFGEGEHSEATLHWKAICCGSQARKEFRDERCPTYNQTEINQKISKLEIDIYINKFVGYNKHKRTIMVDFEIVWGVKTIAIIEAKNALFE